jgi:hypothetical protein
MTSPGLEPAIFWLVARYRLPLLEFWYSILKLIILICSHILSCLSGYVQAFVIDN